MFRDVINYWVDSSTTGSVLAGIQPFYLEYISSLTIGDTNHLDGDKNVIPRIFVGFVQKSPSNYFSPTLPCGTCITATVNPDIRSLKKSSFHRYFGSQ